MIDALDVEIAAAQGDPSRAFEVADGRYLSGREDGHLYAFRAEAVPPIPPETPVRLLRRTGDEVAGVLVAIHDFEVLLDLREEIGDAVDRARVTSEPWFILKALRGRLEAELAREAEDVDLGLAALGLAPAETGEDPTAADRVREALGRRGGPRLVPNAAQHAAIARCAGSRLHFVWGPPGTGKTANLAQVVQALVAAGERVLVLAHANAAVDVAMLRVAEALAGDTALGEGAVLRIGQPQLPELHGRPDVLPEEVLARRQARLVARRRDLEARRREVSLRLRAAPRAEERERLTSELESVRGESAVVREALRQALGGLVRDARVVGATLSRMAIDETVGRWPADSVVVDEASMAALPFVMMAALAARRRLLLFGDFRQLAPIALTDAPAARWWLARDAFDVAGVRERQDRGEPDPRVSLLDTQYRMAEPIAGVVSAFAYGGRLRSAAAVASARLVQELEPWARSAVVLADTGRLGGACVREPRAGAWSRANPVHALVALGLARAAVRDGCGSLAMVTPYRAQARLLAAGSAGMGGAVVAGATVHRIQGSEHDVVIVDLVDGPPQSGASQLTGRDADTALRLLNVAISRARGKLLVLADVAFVGARHPRGSPARALLELLADHGRVEPIDTAWLRARAPSDGVRWLDGWAEAGGDLVRDVERARSVALVNLPAGAGAFPEVTASLRRVAARGTRVAALAGDPGAGPPGEARRERRPAIPPPAPFALLDHRVAWIGGRAAGAAVARVEDAGLVGALSRLLLGDARESPR
jgi:hypothetical protein